MTRWDARLRRDDSGQSPGDGECDEPFAAENRPLAVGLHLVARFSKLVKPATKFEGLPQGG